MKRVLITAGIVAALCTAGTASASFVITNIHQLSPHVRAQLKGNRGPQGPGGPAGPQGAQGPGGPAGAAGIPGVVTVESAQVVLSPSSVNGAFASCPAGDVALGGGWDGGNTPPVQATVAYDYPIGNNTAWDVTMADNGSSISSTFAAVVECAPASAGAAIAHVARSTVQAEAAAAIATARSRR